MASYKIEIKSSAAKELKKIPKKDRLRIVAKIKDLSVDPRPLGCQKLSGEDKYRLRQGNYRILYQIKDHVLTVYIVKIGDPKDVYE